MPTNAPRQPWYALYVFRFGRGRALDGAWTSHETRIPAISQEVAERQLRELLGEGRYEVNAMGVIEVPQDRWPAWAKEICATAAAPDNGTPSKGGQAGTPPPGGAKPGDGKRPPRAKLPQ